MTLRYIDHHRLKKAYERARSDLLAERTPGGHWEGQLSSSALSTATAVSALACVLKNGQTLTVATRLRSLIERGLSYVAAIQNSDGGWGDTDRSLSNIATTMLVRAAIHLPANRTVLPKRSSAETYLDRQGQLRPETALRRDKTFAVPISQNAP